MVALGAEIRRARAALIGVNRSQIPILPQKASELLADPNFERLFLGSGNVAHSVQKTAANA
jgi:hypothetical protein